MAITIAQMCDAVALTLGAAVGMARAQSYDELTEDYPDLPLLQVYPESGSVDITGTSDRTTFRGGTRTGEYAITCDLIARQRAHLGEDMAVTTDLVDAVTTVLEAQNVKPYFGLVGIKGFRWSWQRTLFQRGDPNVAYVGARFAVVLVTF